MNLILTLTLILHKAILYDCKPFGLSIDDNTVPFDDSAIADLLADIARQHIKSNEPTADGDTTKVHMIQLVHKNGSKLPVAIIVTPADLDAYDDQDGNKTEQDETDQINQSLEAENDDKNGETKETLTNVLKKEDEQTLTQEPKVIDGYASDSDDEINSKINEDFLSLRNSSELILSNVEGNGFVDFMNSQDKTTNEDDIYQNIYPKSDEEHQYDDDNIKNDQADETDGDENEEKLILTLDDSDDDVKEYILVDNNYLKANEVVIPQEISSDIEKLSIEENYDDNILTDRKTDFEKDETVDLSFDESEYVFRKDIPTKDNHNRINFKCKEGTEFMNKNEHTDTKTLHFEFIFNKFL